MTSNKSAFESRYIIGYYQSLDQLKKPEQTILNNIEVKLRNMKMLDIGVGTGRTTIHFANLVKEYIGIDYSENMVKVCRQRFSEQRNVFFKICDARNMKIFEDNYFDFILFSWNGIDYVSHEDRMIILQEIIRISKKGGLFCFSTHNLQHIDQLFSIHIDTNPIMMLRRIIRYFLLRFLNEDFKNLRNRQYAIIRDGAQMFRLTHYYISPKEQIKQLRDLGFKNIKIYSYEGEEIDDDSKLDNLTDLYIYYFCSI